MGHFLEMGGYGRFVWPSYALALAVFAWNILAARRRFRDARERAARAAVTTRSTERGPTP